MKRFKIKHNTRYEYTDEVELLPHTLRIRPREGHELRIESSKLTVTPTAKLRWYRDVEENSIAIATFEEKTKALSIESEIVVQKYDLNPHDFLVEDYAVTYPFTYQEEDRISLSPYFDTETKLDTPLIGWINSIWQAGENIQTFSLLNRLNQRIFQTFKYVRRDEEGVQSAEQTTSFGSGSCRDFANLFIVTARYWGLAARFVSGYVYSSTNASQSGSTHAWAEVFIPGAGWKGFDPTFGTIVGAEHFTTAVARRPELAPPVSGSFYGKPGASMIVNVWVTEAN